MQGCHGGEYILQFESILPTAAYIVLVRLDLQQQVMKASMGIRA